MNSNCLLYLKVWMTWRAEDAGSGWLVTRSASPTGKRCPLGPKGRRVKGASWSREGQSGKLGSAGAAEDTASCAQSRPEKSQNSSQGLDWTSVLISLKLCCKFFTCCCLPLKVFLFKSKQLIWIPAPEAWWVMKTPGFLFCSHEDTNVKCIICIYLRLIMYIFPNSFVLIQSMNVFHHVEMTFCLLSKE